MPAPRGSGWPHARQGKTARFGASGKGALPRSSPDDERTGPVRPRGAPLAHRWHEPSRRPPRLDPLVGRPGRCALRATCPVQPSTTKRVVALCAGTRRSDRRVERAVQGPTAALLPADRLQTGAPCNLVRHSRVRQHPANSCVPQRITSRIRFHRYMRLTWGYAVSGSRVSASGEN